MGYIINVMQEIRRNELDTRKTIPVFLNHINVSYIILAYQLSSLTYSLILILEEVEVETIFSKIVHVLGG